MTPIDRNSWIIAWLASLAIAFTSGSWSEKVLRERRAKENAKGVEP